jgi:predicted O-methyltransferase YrrM
MASQGHPDHEHDARWTAVAEYMDSHLLASSRNPYHEALQFARSNSRAKGLKDIAVFAGQGKMLALQIKVTRAKNILEVGTLGGYSAIWMASAGDDVKVTTVEVDPATKAIAEENIDHAGLSDRITVLLGPGLQVLPELLKEVQGGQRPRFDFAFIDADKENNLAYFNYTLQMIRPKSLIYVDNVVRKGQVVDEKFIKDDARTQGIRALIEAVGKDDRVDAVAIQTVADKNYDGFLQALVK